MELYFYDIEISPNGFMITFIPNCPNAYVKSYINCDINHNYKDKQIILEKGIKPIRFIISQLGINEYSLLIDFLSVHKVLIGYNNNNYDNLILDYLYYFYSKFNNKLIHKQTNESLNWILYDISQKIISYGKGYNRIFYNEYRIFKYMKPYTAYDIQKILYLDKSFTSLKQVAIQLKWYRIQDLPYSYDVPWTLEQIDEVYDYNINDVLITRELFNNQINEVKLRNDVSDEYEVNLRNQSRSGMANMLAAKFYEEKSGIERKDFIDLRTHRAIIYFNEIISNKVQFKTDKLKAFLNELKDYKYRVGETFKKNLLFNDTLYTFATGGLHSNDDPKVVNANKEIKYVDCDVSSYYPFIAITLGVFPEHLNKISFITLLYDIVNKRIDNKNIASKLKKLLKDRQLTIEERNLLNKSNTVAEALKICVNAIYGKLGDQDSFLYDLKAMYQVTINGQLMLLMLCEDLELNGFHVISANTDGIVSKVDTSKLELYYNICNQWSKNLDFGIEFTNYEKIIRTAVNDYLAVKEGFNNKYSCLLQQYESYFKIPEKELKELEESYIKEKGEFITEIVFNKGYYAPVIAKCLKARYVYNINTNEYFEFNTDIYDYCIAQKISNDFKMTIRSSDNGIVKNEEIQKNTRYYVSNGNASLIKVYKEPKKNKKGVIVKEINILAHCAIKVFNTFTNPPYDINYNYYKKEVYKTIVDIEETSQTLF